VGDAALGVPYFRSFNVGIKGSIFLAKVIREYLQENILDLEPYEAFMHKMAGEEIFHARVRGAKYQLADNMFYASRYTSDASSAIFHKVTTASKITYSYTNDNKPEEEDEDEDLYSSAKCTIL
jgi:hypothetical protein